MAVVVQNSNGRWLASWRSLPAIAGVILSMAAVVLALQSLDTGALLAAFQQVQGWWVLLALGSVVVNNLAKAARWRAMLLSAELPFFSVLLLHLQGQLWNLVYPVRLGDLGRAVLVEHIQKTPPRFQTNYDRQSSSAGQDSLSNPINPSFALGTVAGEKILDTFVYIILIIIVLVRIPLPPWLNRTSLAVTFGLAILMLTALAVIRWMSKKQGVFNGPGSPSSTLSAIWRAFSSFLRGISQGFWGAAFEKTIDQQHKSIKGLLHPTWLLLLTGIIWLTAVLNNYLVLRATGFLAATRPEFPAWDASLLVLVALMAGLSLPALPLRIGLFEYVCLLSLNVFGVAGEQALVFGLILHAVTLLPIVIGGLAAGFLSVQKTLLFSAIRTKKQDHALWIADSRAGMEDSSRASVDGNPKTVRKVRIMGVMVTAAPMDVILGMITSWASQPLSELGVHKPKTIGYANAHTLNSAQESPVVQDFMQRADLIYADGVSVTWAAQFLHHAAAPKMTGRMWVGHLASLAARLQLRVFLLGGKPGVAVEAGRQLQTYLPHIEIVGEQDGFFSDLQELEILKKIQASRPDILLVGMGSPRQEAWILRHIEELDIPVCWVVGALFDYLAGRERPVPEWLGAMGLEWFWRLVLNPTGKWRRYLLGIPLFMVRILHQKIQLMWRK